MALEINLPNLGNAISVPKDIPFDDPKGYVMIRDKHAIVMNSVAVVVFNLDDYFTNYEEVKAEELLQFQQLMQWLEGKNFTKSMWKDLAGLKKITVVDDSTVNIEAEGYSKNLIYVHRTVLFDGVLKQLNHNSKSTAESYYCVAYSRKVFNFIDKAIGGYVGASPMIIEFVQKEKPARFTFGKKFYMFGLIQPVHSAAEEEFKFENLHNFVEDNQVE